MSNSKEQASEEVSEKTLFLEDAHLLIGDTVNLQAQRSEAIERYSVKLMGMSKGRSVLVTTPMVDGKFLLMRDGMTFIFRAFSGKNAYAFSTQIIKSVNTPYPYLHLAYPRNVRSLVVRKGARAKVNVICAVSNDEDAALQGAGTLVNLSVGGALMVAKTRPGRKGQQLTVKFKVVVSGIEALLELKTIIRAISIEQNADSESPYQVGIQFLDLSANESIPLMAYVYQELLDQSLSA